ncbi:hypothetical protein ILYODFUR_027443 [Ilyodon furcidens]|uniref:Secreted protein n=1 Tax=Ilyodon furcidens TaxID=33524 RepID=A0ABV0VKN2_9TELE
MKYHFSLLSCILFKKHQSPVDTANIFASLSYLLRGIFVFFTVFVEPSIEENYDPYMLCGFGNCHRFHSWRNSVLNLSHHRTETHTHTHTHSHKATNTHT